jgi:hypothetical protein
MNNLIYDNAGYDVDAMVKLSEREFVETHLPNDAIAKNKTPEERAKYLKEVYKAIVQASKVSKASKAETKPAKENGNPATTVQEN